MGEGKTPEAWDAWTARMKAEHGNGNGHGPSLAIEAMRLLPTPTAQTFGTQHGSDPTRETVYSLEAMAAKGMLWNPTPQHDASTAASPSLDPTTTASVTRVTEPSPAGPSSIHCPTTDWGQYADAIARWEALTRPAPAPTEAGPKGSPRLAAAFSEWMMGLPAGWVTDVPSITRNEALKLCGNGVVPQQGAAAVALLLGRAFGEVAA